MPGVVHNFRCVVGRRYGLLLVIERVAPRRYRCRCDCGTEREFPYPSIHTGKTRSCGCLMREVRQAQNFKVSVGMRFGYWTVIAIGQRDNTTRRRLRWRCECECGTVRDISGN